MPNNNVKLAHSESNRIKSPTAEYLIPLETSQVFETMERSVALAALILASPIIALCSLITMITSPGPIFYKQIRVGHGGRLFRVIKMRSMVVNAERKTGATLSWSDDPRVTPFGAIMRKLHLDEIPQLWNVVRGEMRIIGPRPERPEFVDEYVEKIERYEQRHRIKPGITGLAQVSASYHARPEEKLIYDLHQMNNYKNWRLNVNIIWLTLAKILHLRSAKINLVGLLPPSRQLESV